jgi:hypothetical protein
MTDTTIEAAGADILKRIAPKMKVIGKGYNDGETVSIRGIHIAHEVPVHVDGDRKLEQLMESDELREIAQAVRVVCEHIHHGGDRCIDFSAKRQDDGSYTLECQADVPGRILKPLREKLKISLTGQAVAAR